MNNVEARAGDWLEPLGRERGDVIVSNLPYIASKDPHLTNSAHEAQAVIVDNNGPGAIRVESRPSRYKRSLHNVIFHGSKFVAT